jgi:TPR repeat protein
MYLKGQGVAANPIQAVRLFMEGAKKGNAESMLQYARCLEAGTGVTQDATEASSWYREAAKQGNAEAQSWCQEHKVTF